MPKCPVGTELQSLVFDRDVFNVGFAKGWAKRQGYKFGDVDETADTIRLRQRPPGEFTREGFRTITLGKGIKAVVGCPKRKGNTMAKTAVVNRKTKNKRRPHRYGAAKKRHHKRRRNPLPQPKVTAYSSGDYYRRPNKKHRKRNPSMFDLDTWTRILPAGVLGIGAARWAVKMAGPFEDDEPGFKHALAITIAAEVGGRLLGGVLGGAREIDIAQIAAISWGGDLFAQKTLFKDSEWVKNNLYLGDTGHHATHRLGDVYTDAAGSRYVLTRGGWEVVGQPAAMGMGQAAAEPGDVVQDPSGAVFVVQADGSLLPATAEQLAQLQGFYDGVGQPAAASLARRLEAPTRDLPGGSSHVGAFFDQSAIGSFMEHTPLDGHRRGNTATSENSFGYRAA